MNAQELKDCDRVQTMRAGRTECGSCDDCPVAANRWPSSAKIPTGWHVIDQDPPKNEHVGIGRSSTNTHVYACKPVER